MALGLEQEFSKRQIKICVLCPPMAQHLGKFGQHKMILKDENRNTKTILWSNLKLLYQSSQIATLMAI